MDSVRTGGHQVLPDHAHHDVRMDGVFFFRTSMDTDFVKALDAGNFSYCVMVLAGRVRLQADFPPPVDRELGPGDAVAISGLTPHVFRSTDAAAAGVGRFERHRLTGEPPAPGVDLIIGVAPSEALALGSLMIGPIIVSPDEHPELSRRLWGVVRLLQDEYADSWIDRNLVIRRLAEIMLINMSRRVFADRRGMRDEAPRDPASPPIMQAIGAYLRAPGRAWSLQDLARAAGMSRTRFAEEFRLATGQTPGHIVTRMRLTVVARRMASEPLSVEAAAEEAGYSSAAAFVRAFQREFGETPARWGRRRRAAAGALYDPALTSKAEEGILA